MPKIPTFSRCLLENQGTALVFCPHGRTSLAAGNNCRRTIHRFDRANSVVSLVSLDQAISVLGLLSPDFIEINGQTFWLSNAQQYDPQKFHLSGLVETESSVLEQSTSRRDVERYKNIFSISQFFSKWEDAPGRPVFKVGLSE